MPETADDLHARISAAGPDGRLPAPSFAHDATFPWHVVDGTIVARTLRAPESERPREGEDGGDPCRMCAGFGPEWIVWEDERWVITSFPEPSGLPLVLTLWTREHRDIGTFGDDEAADLGRIANRLVRIMEGMDGIGRVHVNRWGDGCSHAHIWFFARPEGIADIRWAFTPQWDQILPPVPEETWRADRHTVASKLANWGGSARA